MQQTRELVPQFDKDKDGILNKEERQAARKFLTEERGNRGGGRGFGRGGFGRRGNQEPPKPGAAVSPADVKSYPDAPLYDTSILRTLFLQFENADWEAELADFKGTDVEVPATLTVDGKTYPNVGVHFRGMSSYMMVSPGMKRSLNLSLDLVDEKQRLCGYKTLNLLNCSGDPSYLHAVLYSHIARQYIPTPKVNLVKVVINGESWGIYANAQQFNNEFLADFEKAMGGTRGIRWKVPGSPGGRGSLAYIGDDVEAYKRIYEIKVKGKKAEQGWKDLIELCRTLQETPADKLEQAISPMLDIDGALWFLALENVLINEDGYWIRTSDYYLFEDETGKFHIIPHDINEAFKPAGGPGMGRGPGGFGGRGGRGGPGAPEGAQQPSASPVGLDPLVAANDARKPLISRLLAVPALRQRYLHHVRTIAEQSLDWNKLEPLVNQCRVLIEKEVEADTRKLDSIDAFRAALGDGGAQAAAGARRPGMPIKQFVQQRREYLLSHPEISKLAASAK